MIDREDFLCYDIKMEPHFKSMLVIPSGEMRIGKRCSPPFETLHEIEYSGWQWDTMCHGNDSRVLHKEFFKNVKAHGIFHSMVHFLANLCLQDIELPCRYFAFEEELLAQIIQYRPDSTSSGEPPLSHIRYDMALTLKHYLRGWPRSESRNQVLRREEVILDQCLIVANAFLVVLSESNHRNIRQSYNELYQKSKPWLYGSVDTLEFANDVGSIQAEPTFIELSHNPASKLTFDLESPEVMKLKLEVQTLKDMFQ